MRSHYACTFSSSKTNIQPYSKQLQCDVLCWPLTYYLEQASYIVLMGPFTGMLTVKLYTAQPFTIFVKSQVSTVQANASLGNASLGNASLGKPR